MLFQIEILGFDVQRMHDLVSLLVLLMGTTYNAFTVDTFYKQCTLVYIMVF